MIRSIGSPCKTFRFINVMIVLILVELFIYSFQTFLKKNKNKQKKKTIKKNNNNKKKQTFFLIFTKIQFLQKQSMDTGGIDFA